VILEDPSNDGDSFLVEAEGKKMHLRLYFVDCPETATSSRSDARRVREQTRYFGLSDPARTVHFGKQAKAFTADILKDPFTVHTAHAKAGGRSAEGRVYAFVTTAGGDDLAGLLVKSGLARVLGIGREAPDQTSRREVESGLKDLEISAMLKKAGIWAECDPDRIAELRAEQRREEKDLDKIRDQVKDAGAPAGRIDINAASVEELQRIKGIGPALAGRIIAGRPYQKCGDLLRVKGIGPKTFKKIQPFCTVTAK